MFDLIGTLVTAVQLTDHLPSGHGFVDPMSACIDPSPRSRMDHRAEALYEGAFFKLRSGGDREKVNQINSLSDALERLRI